MTISEDSVYAQLRAMGLSDAVIAAYDVLRDDGLPPNRCAEIAMASERAGQDPIEFARHFVKLRKVVKEFDGET